MVGLCSYARVSKSKIKNILAPFNVSVKTIKSKDTSKCQNCNIRLNNFSFNNDVEEEKSEFINNYCENHCNNVNYDKEFYYVYEKDTFYGTSETITNSYKVNNLNKSTIKQYLMYHFIPSNKSYCRKSISFQQIAELCNVSVTTARKNHAVLVEVGLVHSYNVDFGKIDIIIADEYKNHLKKKEGGAGYITLSLESLTHLISFNSVNELKLELSKFLWVDARTSSLGKKIKFKRENLIEILPKYIQKSKKNTNKLLNSDKSLFEVKNDRLNTVKYEKKASLFNRLKEEAIPVISNIFEENGNLFSSNYCLLLNKLKSINPQLDFIKDDLERKLLLEQHLIVNNLAELSNQYGLHKVISALRYMLSDEHIEMDSDLNATQTDIDNPGAFIRTLIVNSINNNGSLEIEVA